MAIFRVEISIVAYVSAKDEIDAHKVAASNIKEIAGDDPCPAIDVSEPITAVSQVIDDGWDGECVPYSNYRRDERLNEILPP